MSVRFSFVTAAVIALAQISCATTRADVICSNPVSIDPARREVRNDEWFTLLLRGQDRDCRGTKIEIPRLPEKCAAFTESGDPLPLEALGDDDIVVHRVDKNRRLVWVITRRFSNGEGLGPLALAELSKEHGISIVALGSLRAMTAGAKLRLHPVGEGRKAGEVVTIEGGRCDGSAPDECRRSLVLLARRSTAITNEHLENDRGVCAGPARLDLARRTIAGIENNWQRQFELSAGVTYTPEGIVVHEVVTARDFDPKKRDATEKEVRRAESDRVVRWIDGLLVVNEEPLWERMTK